MFTYTFITLISYVESRQSLHLCMFMRFNISSCQVNKIKSKFSLFFKGKHLMLDYVELKMYSTWSRIARKNFLFIYLFVVILYFIIINKMINELKVSWKFFEIFWVWIIFQYIFPCHNRMWIFHIYWRLFGNICMKFLIFWIIFKWMM